jgi:hypothetical protein
MRDKLHTLIGGIESTVGPKLPDTEEVSAPFFGRGQELAVLRRILGVVRSEGERRAVTLVGPAGIGKSRLIEEFTREVRQLDDPPVRIFRSSAPREGSRWSSFTQLLSQRFDIAEAADLDAAKASVRAQMASVLDDRKVGDVLYLLGDLLDLEFQPSPLTKALEEGAPETEVLKRAILKNFLEADASFGPMCLVFDDLHLCHEPTLAMLKFLIEHVKAPILFLCAGRSELLSRHGALAETPAHTTLQLEPLAEVDSAALIGSVLTPEGMTPMHLVEKARAITGGNPGRIEEAGRFYRDRGTLPPPPTGTDAALETRLEELAADERLILQKAAVMGGVFWFGGLIVLDRDGREAPEVWSPKEEPGLAALSDCLARLSERDYVLRLPDSTFPHDEEYVFRHRAERERIAALTNPGDARRWHRLLADWLDSQPETRSHEEYLELLADQREKAGAQESAASAFLEAAGQARAHGSPKRELAYYEKALALLEDGHSRRLTALLRASELLEQLDKPEAAFERYREAAAVAFRLNRRRLWEAAHLAMSRVQEKLDAIEEAKQAELDRILIEEAKRRAELADQAAAEASAAAAAAAAASAAAAAIAAEPPPPPEPMLPPAPESVAPEPARETSRGEHESASEDAAAPPSEHEEESDAQEHELVAALSSPAVALAAAGFGTSDNGIPDDDRWDAPPAEEAPSDDGPSDEAPTDDASADDTRGDEAESPETPSTEEPAQHASADEAEVPADEAPAAEPSDDVHGAPTDASAPEEAGGEDAPATDQPTMLSAADIEPSHEPPPPPVVVVEPSASADATEPAPAQVPVVAKPQPQPETMPTPATEEATEPAAIGTETGT